MLQVQVGDVHLLSLQQLQMRDSERGALSSCAPSTVVIEGKTGGGTTPLRPDQQNRKLMVSSPSGVGWGWDG